MVRQGRARLMSSTLVLLQPQQDLYSGKDEAVDAIFDGAEDRVPEPSSQLQFQGVAASSALRHTIPPHSLPHHQISRKQR